MLPVPLFQIYTNYVEQFLYLGTDEAFRLAEQIGKRQEEEESQVAQGEYQVPDTLYSIQYIQSQKENLENK